MSELLPCQFCGGTNLKSGGDDKFVGVRCLDCETTGPNHYNSRFDWDIRQPAPGSCGCGPMCESKGLGNCRLHDVSPTRKALRSLVDAVWQHATESTAVPSTTVADKLITKMIIPSHDGSSSTARIAPPADTVREALRELEEVCERLAASRSNAVYDEMVLAGQTDDLIALDAARKNARAALSSPAPIEAGWRDISTAPKDGSEMDLWSVSGHRWTRYRWDHDASYPAFTDGRFADRHWVDRPILPAELVTHWMPMPAAPISRKERATSQPDTDGEPK